MFSIERQFFSSSRLTVSYAGNQGHHLLVLLAQNVGNPQLCLSLPGCGPFGEDAFHTRAGLGPNYGSVTAQKTIGNSNYNALDVNFRLALGNRASALIAYTYSKSIDDASNLGEQINPLNQRATRVLSSFDLTQNFVATYTYNFKHGFSLSGTTRLSTGFPVTLFDDSDRSLLGTLGNGVNNQLIDTPHIVRPVHSESTRIPETASLPSTPDYSRRRRPVSWGIRRADFSMDRELRTSTCKSARQCASRILNRLISG